MTRLPAELATILLAGEWSRLALLRKLDAALGFTGRRVRLLVDRLLVQFPSAPFSERSRLVSAIREDPDYSELRKAGHLPPHPLRRLLEPQHFVSTGIDVPPLEGSDSLSAWLGLPREWLDWFVDLRGAERSVDRRLQHYTRAWIPKAGSGSRLLEAPKQRLKGVQRRILGGILVKLPLHPVAHGGVRGRSAITHARLHSGRKVVAQFDLTDFFPTITARRVAGVFRSLGYPRATAWMLAALCTTSTPPAVISARPPTSHSDEARRQFFQQSRLRERHLPQGSPTSPSLANLCARGLDLRLDALAASLGLSYSRYVDDLAFSTDGALGRASFEPLVREIALDEGFTLNPTKSRVQRSHQQQRVTGLVVNREPKVPRADYDLLRATLHRAKVGGAVPPAPLDLLGWRDRLLGQIAWVAATHPRRGERLVAALNQIDWSTPR